MLAISLLGNESGSGYAGLWGKPVATHPVGCSGGPVDTQSASRRRLEDSSRPPAEAMIPLSYEQVMAGENA